VLRPLGRIVVVIIMLTMCRRYIKVRKKDGSQLTLTVGQTDGRMPDRYIMLTARQGQGNKWRRLSTVRMAILCPSKLNTQCQRQCAELKILPHHPVQEKS